MTALPFESVPSSSSDTGPFASASAAGGRVGRAGIASAGTDISSFPSEHRQPFPTNEKNGLSRLSRAPLRDGADARGPETPSTRRNFQKFDRLLGKKEGFAGNVAAESSGRTTVSTQRRRADQECIMRRPSGHPAHGMLGIASVDELIPSSPPGQQFIAIAERRYIAYICIYFVIFTIYILHFTSFDIFIQHAKSSQDLLSLD